MRVAELSRRSGVPIPTIKYYLREGLLFPGELRRPNQAEYGEQHVHRLALIRSLGDIGGLSLAAIGEVLAAVDEPDRPIHQVLGSVQAGITTVPRNAAEPEAREFATKLVTELLDRRGWRNRRGGPVFDQVVEVLAGLREFGKYQNIDELTVYAEAAYQVAELDVRIVLEEGGELNAVLEGVVAGTVLGEALFAGLRRMAHDDVSGRVLGIPPQDGEPAG